MRAQVEVVVKGHTLDHQDVAFAAAALLRTRGWQVQYLPPRIKGDISPEKFDVIIRHEEENRG